MGSGIYSYSTAKLKADNIKANYSTLADSLGDYAARKQIFTRDYLDPEMDIRGKVRECCNTPEHPNTIPVIIALDVTGSMGHVPNYLITEAFPEIMKKIQDEGIEDVQVCFMGIGDHYYDAAPIQVGQFESSDDLMEKWLTKLYLEGGGGGNDGESYLLAWYAALYHVRCDAIEKQGRKGILITIGDEPNVKVIDANTCNKLFGSGQSDMTAKNLLEEVKKTWHVFHINIRDYTGNRTSVRESWKKYLGDHAIDSQDDQGKDIINLIPVIVTSFGGKRSSKNTSDVTKETDSISEEEIL